MDAIVSPDWLAAHGADEDVRVVDVRWYLDPTRKGRDAYLAGHIPGAVFMDVDRDLSAPGGLRGGPRGRHPWPDAWQVARVMSASGIGAGTRVVAYDDRSGATAARLWFVLRAHGHDAVAVLDGGIDRWRAEGHDLTADVPEPPPRTFTPRLRPLVLDKAAVRAGLGQFLLVDARAAERYRGDTEPMDPRAGHIPGAVSAPFTENLTGDDVPVFRRASRLREQYAALGATARPVVVYCGSGVTACHDILALHLAGIEARLYGGSWSEWSADLGLPTHVGGDP